MTRFDRLNLTSRAFCLAAIVGLSLALGASDALRATLLLAAIGATAIGADFTSYIPRTAVCIAEGAVVALVVGLALPEGVLLLPYLVVPSLIVGVASGARGVLAVVGVESLGLVIVTVTASRDTDIAQLSTTLLPWLITSLGVGLLSAWIRGTRSGGWGLAGDSSYESARRLLTQLRTVARRLSAGLDTLTISSQLLVTVHQHLGDAHSGVFVKTDGGILAPLAYRGAQAKESLTPECQVVDDAWSSAEPEQAPQPSGSADRRNRVVLPLRSGARMIGIVVADTQTVVPSKTLRLLMPVVDDHALRLDTAMAFDEVRTIATSEERRRLAREIHDGVAQEIASLGYAVDDLTATATTDLQRRQLRGLRDEITRVITELRLSIFDLRSQVSGGLGSALSEYVREVGTRSGLTVHLTLDEGPSRLRSEVETELMRIAQEAITNARKHSTGANLWVDCRIQPPFARICVRDDGGGLRDGRPDSYGLHVMRERAERIGADLLIEELGYDEGPRGTSVIVTVGTEETNLAPKRATEVHN